MFFQPLGQMVGFGQGGLAGQRAMERYAHPMGGSDHLHLMHMDLGDITAQNLLDHLDQLRLIGPVGQSLGRLGSGGF